MPDILIRDIPESVLISLDTKAARLGLSRSEYLRRQLAWAAAIGQGTTRVEDWAQFWGEMTVTFVRSGHAKLRRSR